LERRNGRFSPVLELAGLLDFYPNAAAAYSLRRLSTVYQGSAIRVRRASDNTEQNIGFVNNELDTSALTTFCSGTDGFVTTWYDQSGNGRNATQTTAANQPQIVSSGSVITENGKPTLKWDNNDDFMNHNSTLSQPTNYFIASRMFSTASTKHFVDALSGANRQIASPSTGTYTMFAGAALDSLISVSTSSMQLSSYLFNGINSNISINGTFTNGNAGTNSISNYQIGKGQGTTAIDGVISELVIYSSNQSSNQTGIETNINSFYSIY